MTEAPIRTRRFMLRPLTPADVTERYVGWLRDEAARRYIDSAATGATEESVRDYVRARAGRPDVAFFGIFVAGTGEHIGNVKFEPVDPAAGGAVMGMLIGEPAWRGRNVAAEVLDACGAWLQRHRSVSCMVLGVERANTAAVRAYEKAGFEVVDHHPLHPVGPNAITMTRVEPAARRLALGTVQFGLPYGVANRSGQVSLEDARAITARAKQAGMTTLQTAIGYGDSESRLGQIGVSDWEVVTKIPALPAGTASPGRWVRESVAGSLERLKLPRVETLLVHRGADLLEAGGAEIHEALLDLRRTGVIGRIGVSIYEPAELDALMPSFEIDHIQAPFSIVDRRLETSGWLSRLQQRGVEVHARSVFLQGLLLMKPQERPAYFERWSDLWRRFDGWLASTGLSAVEACLGFALAHPAIDRVLVGVDDVTQLDEIVAASRSAVAAPAELASEDPLLVHPMHWPSR